MKGSSELKLPFWSDQDRASPGLREKWKRFTRAMLEHERRHFESARDAAKAIRAEVGPRVSNSPELDSREINRQISGYLRKLRETNRQYDRETGHGAMQGVTLDPG